MALYTLWWTLTFCVEVDRVKHPPIPTIEYIKVDKVKVKK